MTQYAAPISNTSGLVVGGSYIDIDEATYNDSDYIEFSNSQNGTATELGLEALEAAGADTGHVVRLPIPLRYAAGNGVGAGKTPPA